MGIPHWGRSLIVVVGGGITGLALAYQLQQRGQDVTVLEAATEVGGVIRSRRVEGHLLDWGPQRTRLVGEVRNMVEALGLNKEVVTAPTGLPLWVYQGGRLRKAPFSVGQFLTSSIASAGGKLRAAAEPFSAGPDPKESVGTYFRRKFGREVYENLLGPLYGGLYASDPDDMVVGLSLGRVLKEFGIGRSLVTTLLRRGGSIRPPPACSFVDGMQTLPHALSAALGERVRLGTPALALKANGSAWSVDTDDRRIEATDVILTCRAQESAELLRGVAPDAAGRISSLTYNPLAVVHLHADTDLVGLGFQVSLAENTPLRGVTFNDSMFQRDGVYTAYLGGARNPSVPDLEHDTLGVLAATEFKRCTGFKADVLSVSREAMPAWDRSWSALQGLQLPAGLHIAANWESRPGLPGRLAQARQLAAALAQKASRA